MPHFEVIGERERSHINLLAILKTASLGLFLRDGDLLPIDVCNNELTVDVGRRTVEAGFWDQEEDEDETECASARD